MSSYRGVAITNAILRRSTPPPYARDDRMPWQCNITGNPCPGGTVCTASGDTCRSPAQYGTGNAVALGWLDRVRLSGVEITGGWGVGVHFAAPALGLSAPNDYEVCVCAPARVPFPVHNTQTVAHRWISMG